MSEPVQDQAPSTPLDLAHLGALEAMLPLDDLRELIALYLDNARERTALIRAAIACDDVPAIARQAHIVIGTAGNVGAGQASELAAACEAAWRDGEHATALLRAREMLLSLDKASTALTAWLAARHRPAGIHA